MTQRRVLNTSNEEIRLRSTPNIGPGDVGMVEDTDPVDWANVLSGLLERVEDAFPQTWSEASLLLKAGTIADADLTAAGLAVADGARGVNTNENQFVYRSGGQWYGYTPPTVRDFEIVSTVGTAYAVDKRGAIAFKSASRDAAAVFHSIANTSVTAVGQPGLKTAAGNAVGSVKFGPQQHDWKMNPSLPPVPVFAATGDITSGSTTVLNATGSWAVGSTIAGTGIPSGTIVAFVSGSTLTLSRPATATTVGTTLTGMTPDPGTLTVEGAGHFGGGTTIKLSATGQRFLDPGKVADHDWFGTFALKNFLIDVNNIGGRHHVIWGGYINGSQLSRWCASNYTIEGIRTINVPVDSTLTNHRLNVFHTISHTALNEAFEDYCTDATVRDVRFEGGNQGVGFMGVGPANGEVNILFDNIVVEDWWHSLLTVPTVNTSSSHVQIGSRGHGGRCTIRNGYGYGSMDVGIETDAMSNVLVENVVFEENINAPFYTTNMATPVGGAAAQKVVYRRCTAKWAAPRVQDCHAFRIIGYEGHDLGNYSIEDCQVISGSAEWSNGAEFISVEGVNVSNHNIASITVDGFVGSKRAINFTGAVNTQPTLINLDGCFGECVVRIKNVRAHIEGAYAGGATGIIGFRFLQIQGGSIGELEIDGIHLENDVTGLTGANFTSKIIDLGIGVSTTIRGGTIKRLSHKAPASSVTVVAVTIRGTATLTISGRLFLTEIDISQVPSGSVLTSFVTGNENKDKVFIENCRERTLPAPTTDNSKFASATFTSGVDNQYLGGYPANLVFAGGTVTLIEVTTNGTRYTVWSGAGAVSNFSYRVNNGDLVRITHTGAPTVTVVPQVT
jgi:hypothetical protein